MYTYIHIYIYIYIYVHTHLQQSSISLTAPQGRLDVLRHGMYIYIYIYRERERDSHIHIYTHIQISISLSLSLYIYIYIYIYTYILSASWKLPGRFFMVSVVDITQRFRMFFCMVSVVAGNYLLWFPSLLLFNGFRRGRKRFFFMVSVAERFLMVSVAASNDFLIAASNISSAASNVSFYRGK